MKRLLPVLAVAACAAQSPADIASRIATEDDYYLCGGGGDAERAAVRQELRARHPDWSEADLAAIDSGTVFIGMREDAARCAWRNVQPAGITARGTSYTETLTSFFDSSVIGLRGFTAVDGVVVYVVSV